MVSPSACADGKERLRHARPARRDVAARRRRRARAGRSAGGTRGDPRARGRGRPRSVPARVTRGDARGPRRARLEARGAASAEAETEAGEESARETRVDVAFPFNPAGARRVRGRSRAATRSSPDEDARGPRAVALVDVGASRAAAVAAENAIVGSARPFEAPRHPEVSTRKKMPRASGQTSARPVEDAAGSVLEHGRVRVRNARGSRGAVRSEPVVPDEARRV